MGLLSNRKPPRKSLAEDLNGPGTAKSISPSKVVIPETFEKQNDSPRHAARPSGGVRFSAIEATPDQAAAKIQAIKRGQEDRKRISEEKNVAKLREEREKAAIKVQAIAKGKRTRRSTQDLLAAQDRNPCTALRNVLGNAMSSSGGVAIKRATARALDGWDAVANSKPVVGIKASVTSVVRAASKCAGESPLIEKVNTKLSSLDLGKCQQCCLSKRATLSPALRDKVNQLFTMMDTDRDGKVNELDAITFFKSFPKLNARAMLNEVDVDGNGSASYEEMCEFWSNVMATGGYKEEELVNEIDGMLRGGAWTDFEDGRTT
ncbi:hypothetical protein AB1Y20_020766 [Prymnesium parvum]|uniref:EF-hand domain-containing protein n=1 Tax=Prymnesium parvum TaxID=97485 RepID=A0AB34JZ39_PRYPA